MKFGFLRGSRRSRAGDEVIIGLAGANSSAAAWDSSRAFDLSSQIASGPLNKCFSSLCQRPLHSPFAMNLRPSCHLTARCAVTTTKPMNAIADSPARLALLETQSRLRHLRGRVESAAEVPGTFVVNHETGRMTRSPEWQAIFGVPAVAEGDWEDVWRILHPDDRRLVFTAIVNSLDPDGPRALCLEHRILWPDGSVRWVHVTARTSFTVENGLRRPWRTVGTVFDITDRKRAREMPAQEISARPL
jgi:PAS domain S-box-containing protein